ITEIATALILGILTNTMLAKDKEPERAAEIPAKNAPAAVHADAPQQPAKQYPQQNRKHKKGGKGKKKRK
ncbi:MAG: hypothetical protein IKI77_00485, partial [Oscillospiraceae bacterium]|nr:hypothetical protein [Oscillospiraceae bacterium]